MKNLIILAYELHYILLLNLKPEICMYVFIYVRKLYLLL